MKTQIIQLEPHDDIVSTRDKMGWGQTGRILLIWPERGQVLNRRLDLVLLQRHSSQLGAQLALVTRDGEVRAFARQLAIPVFSSLRKAQKTHWRVDRRTRRTAQQNPVLWLAEVKESGEIRKIPERPFRPPAESSLREKWIAFTLAVLALFAMGSVLIPQATLHLEPEVRTQAIHLQVSAEPGARTINLSGILPVQGLTVSVEGRESLPVSGIISAPLKAAGGLARFTNLTDSEVKIPAGTVILSTGDPALRFAVIEEGTVLAGPGQVLSVQVEALTPGSIGNLPAGSLEAIEGSLGTQLSVTNPRPMWGGLDRETTAPSPQDRRILRSRLQRSLEQTAIQEVRDRLTPGDVLLPSTLALVTVLEEAYLPEEIAPADQLELHLRLEFEVQYVAEEDLTRFAAAVLDANLPAKFLPRENTLEIIHQNFPQEEDNRFVWRITAKRTIEAQFQASDAAPLVIGLLPERASQLLSHTFSLQSPPEIQIRPAWWPRMPFLPFRIDIATASLP